MVSVAIFMRIQAVPNYGKKGTGIILKEEYVTIAVEPMLNFWY